MDFEDVAKYRADEFFAAGGVDYVALGQGDYPELPPRNHVSSRQEYDMQDK